MVNPVLRLAFLQEEDAEKAASQHICLCRNEDILLPEVNYEAVTESDFDRYPGFELRFVLTKEKTMKQSHAEI